MAFPFPLTIHIDSKDIFRELQDIFICEEERQHFSHSSGVSLTSSFEYKVSERWAVVDATYNSSKK